LHCRWRVFVCERERTSSIWVWLGALALPIRRVGTRCDATPRIGTERFNESAGSLQHPTMYKETRGKGGGGGKIKCRHMQKLAYFLFLLFFLHSFSFFCTVLQDNPTTSTNFCFLSHTCVPACVFQRNNDLHVLRVFFFITQFSSSSAAAAAAGVCAHLIQHSIRLG